MGVVRKPRDKLYLLLFLLIAFSLLAALPCYAEVFEYDISDMSGVDTDQTTACVDTENQEIRLPKNAPNIVSFDNNNYDYVALTPDGVYRYMFDGTKMNSSKIVDKTELNNPLSLFTSSPYPDVVVSQENTVTHYSFDASNMTQNPALTIQGVRQVFSVGTRNMDIATLNMDSLDYYGYNGSTLTKIPSLSIEAGLINPIDFALMQDTYDAFLLDGTTVYYCNGSLTPILNDIHGVSISAGNNGNVAIVADNEVKHYSFSAGTLNYNSALSITSGLSIPRCVVVNADNNDCLVVDGNDIKYYMFDGSQMVYNPALSVTVAGLQDMGFYALNAWAYSISYMTSYPATHIRLSADTIIPSGTDIKWYLTADNGVNWHEADLGTWQNVISGNNIKWKAELITTDIFQTPIIKPIIRIETHTPPNPPTVVVPTDGCYLTSSPIIPWEFSHSTAGEMQSAYQVIVYSDPGGSQIIVDTGKVPGADPQFKIDSTSSGLIWDSGTDTFWVKVRTWDSMDLASDYSELRSFCVDAFDNPVVLNVVSPPQTNINIPKGCTVPNLTKQKAGTEVTIQIDSIGISSMSAAFPYLSSMSAISQSPSVTTSNGTNKRWSMSFYTNADTNLCPNGTVVHGIFEGDGIDDLLILDNTLVSYGSPPTPSGSETWRTWEGFRWWAEGVVVTNDTVFNDWSVILQGRTQ